MVQPAERGRAQSVIGSLSFGLLRGPPVAPRHEEVVGVPRFWKVLPFLVLALASGLAVGQRASASTRVVIRIPEVLILYLDQKPQAALPIRVEDGAVIPDSVEVRVVANTGWVLWARATPLEGPLTLPPERVSVGGLRLSALPQVLARGRGPFLKRYPLSVELLPGEPTGVYRGTITFNLARP